MTSHYPPTGRDVMPFQRYLDATHAARDAYLATTYAAHRQYLTGPWPDRTTYQQVENTAWTVYYTAAREAWQRYTDELSPPPVPSPTPPEQSPAAAAFEQNQVSQRYWDNMKNRLTRDAGGEVWPTDPPRHNQPTDPAGDAGYGLDQFDQRQETYLAADPNRRDNP